MRLGEYLRSLRKGKDMSLRELSANIGYSYSYISGVEKGSKSNPSDKFISRYIKGVSANDKEMNEISNRLVQNYDIQINPSDVDYFSGEKFFKLESILLIDCKLDGKPLEHEDKRLLVNFMRSYIASN